MYNEGKTLIYRTHIEIAQNFTVITSMVEDLARQTKRSLRYSTLEQILDSCQSLFISVDDKKIFLDFQTQMFHGKTGNFVAFHPPIYDPKKRQIFLVVQSQENKTDNLCYIPRLVPFFKLFGKFCCYCQKFFTSRGCEHHCSFVTNCFACRRPYLQKDIYTTYETIDMYCDGLLMASPSLECSNCHVSYHSTSCFDHHKKKVCRWGWKCPKCKIYQSRNNFFKSQDHIQQKHICGTRFCNFCGDEKNTPHFCTLKQFAPKEEYTNLAFLQIEYSGYNISKCKNCFELYKVQQVCAFCNSLPKEEVPFACILLQEEKGRQSFSRKFFFDDDLMGTLGAHYKICKEKALTCDYIPNFCNKQLAPEGQKTRFGKRKKPQNVPMPF